MSSAPIATAASTLQRLRRSDTSRYLIVDARLGLAERLRALGSALAVAAALRRPLLLLWVADAHIECGFDQLFAEPPFEVLSEPLLPLSALEAEPSLKLYNYMREEPGGRKSATITADPARHLYFRGSSLMNHSAGHWWQAAAALRENLAPIPSVAARVIAQRWMVGIEPRSRFVVPWTQYGLSGAADPLIPAGLFAWRNVSHHSRFLTRMVAM